MAGGFLSGVEALLLDQGLGKTRVGILSKQLVKFGGVAVKELSESTTHILVGNNTRLARVPVLLKIPSIPETVPVLRADWLSSCLAKRERLPEEAYRVHPEYSPRKPTSKDSASSTASTTPKATTVTPGQAKAPSNVSTHTQSIKEEEGEGTSSGGSTAEDMLAPKAGMFGVTNRRWKQRKSKGRGTTAPPPITAVGWDSADSDYVESDQSDNEPKEAQEENHVTEKQQEEEESDIASPPKKKKGRWICEMSSTTAQTWVNHNKHITDKLEELLVVYKNDGEKWRVMSTTKAIQAIKKHPKEITTLEEARSIQFVGERLAKKIEEIISSGGLRRLDNVDKERERIIHMFMNIHGVGQVTAQQFYAQGFRSLQDLKDADVLNRVQLIGVKYFDEFIERMPREEVAEIEAKVKAVCRDIKEGLEVVTCGSYRRGKLTCGDIDILVTHPDGRSHRGVMDALLERGHACGLLTDDLSVHNDPEGSGKYLGVCKLKGEGRKHRRIDIMVVPYCEFFLALVHFTGSGHLNRSMRSKADKMGMSLSEHAMCTGVIRKNGVKVFNGTPLPIMCEQDVFRYLELDYLEPVERDWD